MNKMGKILYFLSTIYTKIQKIIPKIPPPKKAEYLFTKGENSCIFRKICHNYVINGEEKVLFEGGNRANGLCVRCSNIEY